MPLKVDFNFPVVDVDATRREIDDYMSRHIVLAAKAWVLSTTEIVPVLTGAAKASFIKLASAAETTLTVNPIAPSRIDLGIETSEGAIEREGETYRFLWSSELAHIGIVEDRVGFLSRGQAAINALPFRLPPPEIKTERA